MEDTHTTTQYITRLLSDLIFPEHCLGCSTRGTQLCGNCIQSVRSALRETDTDIFACFDYRDPLIKKAIWNLKYYRKRNLGQILGKLLYENQIEEISDMRMYASGDPIIVIPVPITRKRARMRGYNQAESIARGFCSGNPQILKLKTGVVQKRVNTIPQAHIENRAERLRNVKNAFEVTHPEIVQGKTVIVIDDVTTTGGTLHALITLLQKSGASRVVGFAVAH